MISVVLVASIALAVVLGYKTKINTGFFCIAFAYLIGCFALGMKTKELIACWPTSTMFVILSVSLFYNFAAINGTLEKMSSALLYACRSFPGLLPFALFFVAVILSVMGAAYFTVLAFLAPITLVICDEAKMDKLTGAVAINCGALAGGNFPTAALGVVFRGLMEISEKVYGGLQEPAGSYFSWRVPGTDVGIAPYGQDLEEAGRILEEAGWIYAEGESIRSKNGQRLELRLVYDDSIAGNGQVGELLKAQYEAAGIQVDLVPQTGAAYEESWQSGQFDLLLSRTWGIPYEPYGSFFCMASPGDKFHLVQSGMSGKRELDVIMRDTLGQNDGERMKEDMAYIMESLHNEAVYVPLTEVVSLAVYREGLSGPDMDSARAGLGIEAMEPLEP